MDRYLDRCKRRYSERITRAKPAELVRLSLEMALDFIENGDFARARKAVCQLAEALDFKYGLSRHLYNIYAVIEKKLTAGIVSNDLHAVNDAKYLIRLLSDKWMETESCAKNVTDARQNRNNVYVGLTYNASGLCEYAEQDLSEGYKA